MLPYWLIFSLLALGSWAWQIERNTKSNILLILAAAILTFFIGLRYEVGADWSSYVIIFESTKFISLDQLVEGRGDPGFYLLVWLTHKVGYEIWALNLVCAVIFVVGLVAFSKRTPNPWLSLAIAFPYLVIVVAMSGMRQATAIGFYFLALNAFSGRRLGAAVVWTCVASMFHASAIIMLGVAALSFTRNRLKMAGILIVTAAVGYFALRTSFGVYVDRYSQNIQSSGTIFRLIMNFVPAIIFLKYRSKFRLDSHEEKFWRNLSYFSILSILLLFVVPSSTAIDRMSLYLIPLQCFVLSGSALLFGDGRREKKIVTVGVLTYLGTAMFVFLNFSATNFAWNNYQFYPFDDVQR